VVDPALRPGARDIGAYLVSARSFEEYWAMFALTDGDLAGRVLDCPGGGAGFTAIARARGTDAVAVDPVYATSPAALAARLAGELERGRAWTRAHADRYAWDFHGDLDGHTRVRAEAARAFAGDRAAAPGRYVCAALPALPFRDGAFDLVLSSHLLFTYADRLDRAFHRAALLELARVSRGPVRVYPLVDQAGRPLPGLLTGLVDDLAAAGVAAEVRDVGYEFQRGARSMLQLTGR
jgi:SAM-dependent methyltransferase